MKGKKIISVLCSAALVFSAAAPASALGTDKEGSIGSPLYTGSAETCSYYFLAPEDWFRPEYGAENEDIGCYWWLPEETAEFPGVKMTPAFDIGENVFKAEVPKQTNTIIFSNFIEARISDPEYGKSAPVTQTINTEGYEKGECEYDPQLVTDSFDGWIYVLNRDRDFDDEYEMVEPYHRHGAWFRLDDYKNHADYYGTYSKSETSSSGTIYFDASKWGSESILFYIFDKNTGKVATPDGWTDEEMWGNTALRGTPSMNGNGVFESFEFKLESDQDVYVIFHDPKTDNQLVEIKLDADCLGKCAYPTGEFTDPSLSDGKELAAFKSDFDYVSHQESAAVAGATIYFDASEWGSESILFYIFDKNTGKVATPNGWTDEEMWGNTALCGTPSANGSGVFQSFKFDLESEQDAYVIFHDPKTDNQLAELKLDFFDLDTCAYPTGEFTDPSVNDGKELAAFKSDFDFTEPQYGDLDGDGQITAGDALEALRLSSGLLELTAANTKAADVDGDGQVTASDALAILRHSAGADDENSIIGKPIE